LRTAQFTAFTSLTFPLLRKWQGAFPEASVKSAKPRPPVFKPAAPKRGVPGDADLKAKSGMHDKAGGAMKGWIKRQGMG
jgi:hypothetical protein